MKAKHIITITQLEEAILQTVKVIYMTQNNYDSTDILHALVEITLMLNHTIHNTDKK